MRFVTYRYEAQECIGIAEEGRIIPLGQHPKLKYRTLLELIQNTNDKILIAVDELIANKDVNFIPEQDVKILAPIPFTYRNVFCLGKNYVDHAREIKMTQISDTGIPDYPIYFSKTANPAIGDGDDIIFSHHATTQVDYEVELAVVIGKDGTDISPHDAYDHIFGYTIINDVSARDLQGRHIQWLKGKCLDTFCPMGPGIVHKNEILNPGELNIQCRVNGELRQNSNTCHMIFDIPYIISDLSKGLTLKAGDIICTGTPSGVGMGFDPPVFLHDGDVVECYIEKIGKLTNRVRVI